MNINKVKNLLKKEESTKLDFKLTIDLSLESGKKEFAKDVAAIANARGGRGYLVIGVQDKSKNIIGIDPDNYGEEKIQQIISSRIDPPVPISLDFVQIEGKYIAVITIYDGKQKPYQIRENGAFVIRRGSTTDFMRRVEVANYLTESFNLDVELVPVIRSNIDHINKDLVKDYIKKKGIYFSENDFNENDFNELMENIGIVTREKESGKYIATLGGLLVFCKENSIYLPHNMVKIVNKINKEYKENFIVQGDIISIIEKSMEIIDEVIGDNLLISNAINEAIKNAVLYRDYTVFDKCIEVEISKKGIIITSPGAMMTEKYNNSVSIRRNMWIYEKIIVMESTRYVKKYSGFETMKKNLKQKGRVRFINSLSENSFKVIFPPINKTK